MRAHPNERHPNDSVNWVGANTNLSEPSCVFHIERWSNLGVIRVRFRFTSAVVLTAATLGTARSSIPSARPHIRPRHMLTTGALVALMAVLGGCSNSDQPVVGQLPDRPPVTHVASDGACLTNQGQPSKVIGDGNVTVDSSPSGVSIVWLPGFNTRPCLAALTHAGAEMATALANDIQHAPDVSSGATGCSADDGAGVRLYFSYAGGHPTERADVNLTGCKAITAPGRSPRSATQPLLNQLGSVAPNDWRLYFVQ